MWVWWCLWSVARIMKLWNSAFSQSSNGKKIARILSQASSLKKFELWSDEDFLFPVDRAANRRSKKINGRRKNNLDCPSPRARSQARARSLLLRVLLLLRLRLHRCMCCYFRAHGARARASFLMILQAPMHAMATTMSGIETWRERCTSLPLSLFPSLSTCSYFLFLVSFNVQ